ncbi:hypothetical protein VOLCADRAFT_108122 [Volvox carteri f. nagariensis]|uniref:Uncharacterized protein n=1 Tax=Volvox carteri f. nagariensis TaxID=3068 RepID=D8UID0_VOLCA|nr:uncharacterized protein VOLCADRAFT_108122 [Volvox carteri f. nagariensis]EFJ40507.1 hypothetical protein VOLCADRAFT_108122 [Volvox carteri f. nagariensis]|eukprot:XP_002958431.1 hypothetical protein VOLCADRAFT_108122 [Volvox carteri f. nagariensis]
MPVVEGGASATVQLPPTAPGDTHGGEAAALPSPSAAGPAAIAGPRFPCTEGGASATVQLPPTAPGDTHGGEAAALPSPSAAGPAAIAGPRFPCTEGGASATVQLPPTAPGDTHGGEAAAQAADERRRLLPNDEAHLEREIHRMAAPIRRQTLHVDMQPGRGMSFVAIVPLEQDLELWQQMMPKQVMQAEPTEAVRQDAVSAGKLTHQQKAYWTVTNSTGPSVDTISRNAAIGFKQAQHETLPEGFLLEMHETYLRHSTDYSDLFGVFTAWLWEQWTDDTTPGPFLSDYLSHLRLRTHSRRTLLHRDSHGSVSMRNKV